ncbi:hypothetical protein SS1G_05091 [Sclerotinia sclerotiorum 1980 UF-70]|uniref:Uncharacterized protein n=1 Tax=Sclerotinia sclerotiorum (strain ATCC 18683 / 1980 / Ss-1) TaxID=665079 RepID=A7EIE8_SCLS1|nr:hypothetical protein SS1G_05091 [Sclerotinia sclerotiorum 1980 UF-70]EDO02614.1 hypothetical protein SS1G_05091 [Sclerotinia sclerotiorum 1980 UF-70]
MLFCVFCNGGIVIWWCKEGKLVGAKVGPCEIAVREVLCVDITGIVVGARGIERSYFAECALELR